MERWKMKCEDSLICDRSRLITVLQLNKARAFEVRLTSEALILFFSVVPKPTLAFHMERVMGIEPT